MIRWVALTMFIWASPTFAALETWPALYNVQGVATNDALNVRRLPDVTSEIIGTLAYDAKNIEVVDVDDEREWGRVNIGDGSGWVSLRFMERDPRWAGSFPPITACYGTEPFWNLTRTTAQTDLEYFNDVIESVSETLDFTSQNRVDRFGMIIGNSSAFIMEGSCTDGMSDRYYGLSIEVMTEISGAPAMLSGCCTIQP